MWVNSLDFARCTPTCNAPPRATHPHVGPRHVRCPTAKTEPKLTAARTPLNGLAHLATRRLPDLKVSRPGAQRHRVVPFKIKGAVQKRTEVTTGPSSRFLLVAGHRSYAAPPCGPLARVVDKRTHETGPAFGFNATAAPRVLGHPVLGGAPRPMAWWCYSKCYSKSPASMNERPPARFFLLVCAYDASHPHGAYV